MTNIAEAHRAAVISAREVAYGNGTALRTRPDIVKDLALVLGGTMDRFAQHSTIVLDGVRPEDVAAQSTDLRAAGWKHSRMEAWTLFHRADGRTVAVGFRDAMTPRLHFGTLFERDTDPGVLAITLDRFSRVTGCSWRGTCATTALAGIRLSWENPNYQPLWRTPKTGIRNSVGPLNWLRPLNENETWWGFVHTFDANSAYLGSAISADLAWSELHHTGPQVFDPTLPGYWLIELDVATLELMADPARPPLFGRLMRNNEVWVTTPYAKMLQRLGDHIEVADSWTARPALRADGSRLHPAGSRVLRTWGETLRDGLAQHMATLDRHRPVEVAAKRVYKDGIGGMQREGMRILRPDWAHTVIELWRATLLERVLTVRKAEGVWPVRIATDSISYADSGGPATLGRALGLTHCEVDRCRCSGRRPEAKRRLGLGGYKHTETVTTAEWTARHAVKPGRSRRGR